MPLVLPHPDASPPAAATPPLTPSACLPAARPPRLLSLLLAALACGCQLPARAATGDDDDLEFRHLWPLVENARQADGSRQFMALFYLFHRTSAADGTTRSFNILNYLQTPDLTAVLPFYWRYGPVGQKRTVVAPFYLQGPGYAGVPLLASGGWTRADGGQSLWITPLFHRSTDRDGRLEDTHALLYAESADRWMVLPLAYHWGHDDQQHTAILPVFFSGPGWWSVPVALTGQWQHDDGGRSTWITPFAHVHQDAAGAIDQFHLLTYYHDHDHDVLAPLVWSSGHLCEHRLAVLPVWTKGPRSWTIPVALSGSWRTAEGGRSTWVTPLMHVTSDWQGRLASMHVLNYVHDRDLDLVFPLAWRSGPSGGRTGAVLPFYLQGRSWWCAPLALSLGRWSPDGAASVWITPLAHASHDGSGRTSSWHLLLAGGSHSGGGPNIDGKPAAESASFTVLPLFYHSWHAQGGATAASTLFIPFVFANAHALVIPPLLSAHWSREDGSSSLWLTPLYHRSTRGDGSVASMHAATDFSGSVIHEPDAANRPASSRYHIEFPFYYRWDETAHGSTSTYTGVLPLWLDAPSATIMPPILSMRLRNAEGGASTWVTPLFHLTSEHAGAITDMHLGPYYQSPELTMLLPLAYRWGKPEARHLAIVPLFVQGPDSFLAPLALTSWRRAADGAESLWITPLVHLTSSQAGSSVAVTPFFYKSGATWSVPLALTAHWPHADGGSSTWVTPLAHIDRRADGTVDDLHLLSYVHTRSSDTVLPLFWLGGEEGHRHLGLLPFYLGGTGYRVVPLAGSWWTRRPDGGGSLWITPLAHRGTDASGRPTDWHVLNVVHHGDLDAVIPLMWASGDADHRRHAVLPAWFSGPGYWLCPPLLSGASDHADGSTSLWITPLMHRDRDQDGHWTSWHALTAWHHGDTTGILPLAWWSGPAGARRIVVLPCFSQGPGYRVLAPLWYRVERPQGAYHGLIPFYAAGPDSWIAPLALAGQWRSGPQRTTTVITPLYHRTTEQSEIGAASTVRSMHLLNYIETPDGSTAFPLYWQWRTADGGNSHLVLPLCYEHCDATDAGDLCLLPALVDYHHAHQLDTSLGRQLIPFLVQRADDGHELNILWRAFHWRSQGGTTEVGVSPLWWTESRAGVPVTFQILGGLIARTCNPEAKTSRVTALLGLIPITKRSSYAAEGNASDAATGTLH